MRNINKIIIHCSATPEGRNVTVQDIDKWHRQKGYNSIGYHYVIMLDGTICEGRSIDKVGAHCRGHNSKSIGICYIGGCDKNMNAKDTRTPEQKNSLIQLVNSLKLKYPNATIHGHNEFSSKSCPCFNVKEEFGK